MYNRKSYAKPQQRQTKTLSCDFFKPFTNSENFERSFQNVKYKIDCITINQVVASILPTLWLFKDLTENISRM